MVTLLSKTSRFSLSVPYLSFLTISLILNEFAVFDTLVAACSRKSALGIATPPLSNVITTNLTLTT